MKRSHALLVIASIGMLIAICLIAMPYFLVGAPSPLFCIHNYDSKEHKVVIEIFDSNNESVFEQTYELAPEAEICQSKPTWLLLQVSIPPGNTKDCTFKATLDDNIMEKHQIGLQPWVTASIILYRYNAEYNAKTPLWVLFSTA